MNNKEKHYQMWDRLARTGELYKRGAFYALFDESLIPPTNYCFACEEALSRLGSSPLYEGEECEHCPLDWGTETCISHGSPYDKWVYSKTVEERKYWAGIIRDLPWRSMESQSSSLMEGVSVA